MTVGKVQKYYNDHFEQLTLEKKFHYATRTKNQAYLNCYKPVNTIQSLLAKKDFSKVLFPELRAPFFAKYPDLFALEATLVYINHLLNIYGDDHRQEFTKLFSLQKLYQIVDNLENDDEAIIALSTYAINVISLTETLFPRRKTQLKDIAKKSLEYTGEPVLLAYLYTHIIICATDFYYHKIPEEDKELYRKVLQKAASLISANFSESSLDIKLEILVCAKLLQCEIPDFKAKTKAECQKILVKNPYLVDSRRPARANTLDGAEHRNALFIMSGLDLELS